MGLAEDLLEQARYLTNHDRGKPKQATLRRAISTAYYSVFHLLVANAALALVPNKPLGLVARVSRAFQHGEMKQACRAFTSKVPVGAVAELVGLETPDDLRMIAETFIALQELRHMADYDTSASFTRAQAQETVNRAEEVFRAWSREFRTDEAKVFLAALAFGARWSR